MKLYELTAEMKDFERYCEENPDLDEQTKRDTLDSMNLSIEKKIIGVLKAMENLELPVPGIDKTIKRLQKNKRVIEGKVKWYNRYVKENMEAGKVSMIEEKGIIKVRLQDSLDSLEITCEIDQLPKKYWKTETVFVAQTDLIKAALKAGKKIEGCKLKKGKHIRLY